MHRTRRPKLGQHFLTDSRYRARIVAALPVQPDDLVVEIGPGRGAMTELLAERAARVLAIELDPTLAGALKEKLAANPQIEVVQDDFLAIDLGEICRQHRIEQCFVFGNLPYYITSPIIRHLFEAWPWVRAMALLVQREVAERLTAAPGSRAYGYLSVLAQLHSAPHLTLGVPPGAFSPPPRVHSALVSFEMKPRFRECLQAGEDSALPPTRHADPERQRFLSFVKRCFAHKRKNLLNNLARVYRREGVEAELQAMDLPRSARAEQLSLQQLGTLFQRLREQG